MVIEDNPTKSEHFPNVARQILGELQVAVAELIAAVPGDGKSIRRAATLQRALGIDRKLAWQIFKLTTEEDPVAAGLLIPRKMSVAKVLQHARDRALPHAVLARASDSFAAYDQLVAKTAGDREVFDSMLSGIARDGADPLDLVHKRAAVRASTHFLGVHAEAIVKTWIFHPSADGVHIDKLNLVAFTRFKRLRIGAPMIIVSHHAVNNDGTKLENDPRPLDPAAAEKYGIPLMEEFSGSPLPRFEQWLNADGSREVAATGDVVGQASSCTFVIGDYVRKFTSRFKTEVNKQLHLCARVRTPTERMISDLLIARGTFGPIQPSVSVYSDHNGNNIPYVPQDLLPVRETIRHIPSGVRGIGTPEVPQYARMVDGALKQFGWNPNDFELYRCVVEYPILPSTVMTTFDLNEQSTDE